VRRLPQHPYAGYLPIVCVFAGAWAGGWLASAVGTIEWPLALVGIAVAYLVSGSILRRIYSSDCYGPD
jgi:hypothetical protein